MWRLLGLVVLMLVAGDTGYEAITPDTAERVGIIHRKEFPGHYIHALDFHPQNSRVLAIARSDGFVVLGEQSLSQPVNDVEVTSLAYTPDAQYLVTADKSGGLKVWDADTTTLVRDMRIEGEIPLLVETAQGNIAAVGYKDGTVRLWDVNTGELLVTLFGYHQPVRALDIALDGSKVAFGYGITWGEALVYRLEDVHQSHVYLIHVLELSELNALAFNPHPPLNPRFLHEFDLVTAINFISLEFWDTGLAEPVMNSFRSESRMAYPAVLTFSNDGQLVAAFGAETAAGGGCDTNRCPIEIISAQLVKIDDDYQFPVLASLDGHKSWPTDVEFSDDDRFLASSSSDGLILIWGVVAQ